MAVLKAGIIGVGGIGERVLASFLAHPETEVLGLFDANTDRLDEVSRKHGVAAVSSHQELLSNPDINLIYIAVPPKFHHSFVMEALAADKNLLCEKPLAGTAAEAEEMAEAARSRNLIAAVNFPTIFGAEFKAMEQYVKDGFLGELRRIELHCHFEEWPRFWQKNSWISSREQGGFVREVFPHYINIIQHLFGEISGITSTIEYPDNPDLCETGILATARISNGVPVLFNGLSGIGMKELLRFDLYGSEGSLSLLNWSELWASRKGETQSKIDITGENGYQLFLDELITAFEGKKAGIVTFEQGLNVQKVLDQLLQF